MYPDVLLRLLPHPQGPIGYPGHPGPKGRRGHRVSVQYTISANFKYNSFI